MNNIVYELLSPYMNNYTDPEQFRRTISKAIALPVILALILSAGFIGIIFHLMSVGQLADHSNQVIAQAHENLQLSINSQTGVRGFLITGNEVFDLKGIENDIKPQQQVTLVITRANGDKQEVKVLLRIDTPIEVDYYKHGGILPFVLRQLLAA